jgi:BirA family transcriptional regulator, biotin operon repressor / biotin---[acetyl-CoA-carboxylase] ligase
LASFWLGPIASNRGYRLVSFNEIGSTSTEAVRAGEAGDVGDVWFAALKQTAGRGRRGRAWETPSGNLAASLLIVPQADPAIAATLGFVAGVALNAALADVLPAGAIRQGLDGAHRLALKWPNDVLADGAKLAGILLEANKRSDGRLAIVVGFGVNVVSAPEGLPYPATSIQALGVDATAEKIFAALSDSWIAALDLWNGGKGVADVLKQWRAAAAGIGSEVAVSQDGRVIRGIFESIDDAGRLVVRANDNRLVTISAGDVHFGVTASVRA